MSRAHPQCSFRQWQRIWIIGSLLAATANADQLPLRLFTSANGLASNSINRTVRDSRNHLWLCTGEGLSRFDGTEFKNYGTNDGLPTRSVRDLLETHCGEYLVATNEGIAYFITRAGKGAKFERVRMPRVKGALHVNVLAQDEDGAIWCGTNSGLYRLHGTRPTWEFRQVDLGARPEPWATSVVSAVIPSRDGGLWVGGEGGLWKTGKEGQPTRWTERHGLTSPVVLSLAQDRDGKVWVGTERGLCTLVANPRPETHIVERCYTTQDGLPSDYVQELLLSSDRELWAGTLYGAARMLPNGRFDAITLRRGLSDNNIEALGEDSERNIWFGSTGDGGAARLSRSGAVIYGESDGLDSRNVIAAFSNQHGEVCAMTRSKRGMVLHRFRDGRFERRDLPNSELPPSGRLADQVALEDRDGDWWVATGKGLIRFPKTGGQITYQNDDPAKRGAAAFRVFADSHGNIWWSTNKIGRNGLAKWEYQSKKVRSFSEKDGLPSFVSSLPTAFVEDRTGAIWFGIEQQGLVRYRNGQFDLFPPEKGGPIGIMRAPYVDRTGRLWAGSGLGLWRVDHPEAERPVFRSMGVTDGLSSPSIRAFTEDALGRIYAVSGGAVDRIDPQTGNVRHYTTDDGLPFGTLQTAHRESEGALWFGSTRGISRLVVDEDPAPPAPPRALIRGLRVRGMPAAFSELGETDVSGPELAPDENQIEFQFGVISFRPGLKFRFQYRLDGSFRSDWSAPSESKSASFASLGPGTYRFLVRAVSESGTPGNVGSVSFLIRPPIWARWWIRTTGIILGACFIYAVHRYRVARLIELERVRTRIATDLHDDIGSSLSQIAMLSELAHRSGNGHSAAPLEEISGLARELVASMSDIVCAVNPNNDHLSNLVYRIRRFATDLLGTCGMELRFHAPDAGLDIRAGAEIRRHVYLIFKEAMHNIVRHSHASVVDVALEPKGDTVLLRVADDGQRIRSLRELRWERLGKHEKARRVDRRHAASQLEARTRHSHHPGSAAGDGKVAANTDGEIGYRIALSISSSDSMSRRTHTHYLMKLCAISATPRAPRFLYPQTVRLLVKSEYGDAAHTGRLS